MKKDWIARELTVEVVVGVFLAIILLGLFYFLKQSNLNNWPILLDVCIFLLNLKLLILSLSKNPLFINLDDISKSYTTIKSWQLL